ncbi:MAG: hypothetical protein CW338_10220 [Clostridiales bacterium]|nr:hypothetical protein [Clostridiales bacterium]
MKKRFAVILTALIMLTACVFPAAAEENDPAANFDFFLSRAGNILFTMNTAPDAVYHEVDFIRSPKQDLSCYMGITDNTQLTYADENGEWQYHIADLSLMIGEIRTAHPEADEMTLQFNALGNFALIYITMMTPGTPSGDIRPLKITGEDGQVLAGVEIDYTYADTPGVAYRCTGFIDSSRAVLLMGSLDERYEVMARAFGPVTSQREQDYTARMTPSAARLGELTVTFPCVPDQYITSGRTFLDGFTSDYAYISAEHMETDISYMFDPENTDGSILELMEYVGMQYVADGTCDSYEASLFAPGIGLVKCTCLPQMEGFEDHHIIWCFMSARHGPYVFHSSSSPEGLAFLNSIRAE